MAAMLFEVDPSLSSFPFFALGFSVVARRTKAWQKVVAYRC